MLPDAGVTVTVGVESAGGGAVLLPPPPPHPLTAEPIQKNARRKLRRAFIFNDLPESAGALAPLQYAILPNCILDYDSQTSPDDHAPRPAGFSGIACPDCAGSPGGWVMTATQFTVTETWNAVCEHGARVGSGWLVLGLIPHVCTPGVGVPDEGSVVNGSDEAYTVTVVVPGVVIN
jgi:hypothetical protein